MSIKVSSMAHVQDITQFHRGTGCMYYKLLIHVLMLV